MRRDAGIGRQANFAMHIEIKLPGNNKLKEFVSDLASDPLLEWGTDDGEESQYVSI